MPTHDMVINNAVGATVRSDINSALAALVANSSNATEPATMYAYQIWFDTSAGYMKQRNSTNTAWVALSIAPATAAAHAMRGSQYGSQINGWTYANNVTDAVNDLDIAAGSGLDATRAYFIAGAALTKRSDVAWAVGTNAGMLDTGAVGNSDYYIWAIARSDTGVVDYLSSLSNTAPTMPANYNYKRLIGWFKRVGGTIVAFHTYELAGGGLQLTWDTPTRDIDLSNTLTTSRRTDAIKVPLTFSVLATISVICYDASALFNVFVGDPNSADGVPGGPELCNLSSQDIANSETQQLEVRTSATGTIAARSNLATIDAYQVATYSFKWERRV